MVGIQHGGGLTWATAVFGGIPGEWLDLSTGINPNSPELPEIPMAVWNRLPDRALVEAAQVAARDWYCGDAAVEKTRVHNCLPLAVPGTQAFIQILPRLVPQARPVAILSPTYGEYAHCFEKSGFVVDRIRSLSELEPAHGTLVVVNPNNPDGRHFSGEALLELHARLQRHGAHLHVDEAFGDARPESSLAGVALRAEGLTVSRSFGKFFGMAGIRLGFAFAAPSVLDRIDSALGPWAVSGPALHLATELMRRDRTAILRAIEVRKAALQRVLEEAGHVVVGGTELFTLVALDNAAELFDHLATRNILVRKFDYAPQWLRIGLAPDEQGDKRLADALASF